MQFMLNIYEFADDPGLPSPPDRYPKTFVVERFRGYRPMRATLRVPRRWDRVMCWGDLRRFLWNFTYLCWANPTMKSRVFLSGITA